MNGESPRSLSAIIYLRHRAITLFTTELAHLLQKCAVQITLPKILSRIKYIAHVCLRNRMKHVRDMFVTRTLHVCNT